MKIYLAVLNRTEFCKKIIFGYRLVIDLCVIFDWSIVIGLNHQQLVITVFFSQRANYYLEF